MSKKFKKTGGKALSVFLSATTVVWLSGAAMFVPVAQAATLAELQAMLNDIQAQIAALTGGGSSTAVQCTFTRSLSQGVTGSDVQCLQRYLNGAGHQVAASGSGSPGNETTYFGGLTRAAVSSWQAANGVSPTAGYFGQLSQAKYNALVAGGGPPPPPGTTPPTTMEPPTLPSSPPNSTTEPSPPVVYTLSVLSPPAGDIVRVGATHNIVWSITPLPGDEKTARVYLKSLDGKREIPIAESVLLKNKTYAWVATAAELLPGRFVVVLDTGDLKAESDFFTLARKDWADLLLEETRLRVVIPAKNEIWAADIPHAIEWNAGGYSWAFKLELLVPETGAIVHTIAGNIPNTGLFLWSVPGFIQAGEYKVRVQCTSCSSNDVYDDSDAFTLTR